jgi:hypothetical protein
MDVGASEHIFSFHSFSSEIEIISQIPSLCAATSKLRKNKRRLRCELFVWMFFHAHTGL